MPDWRIAAQAAIDRLRAHSRLFPEEQSIGLIDQFAHQGTLSKTDMCEGCSPYIARLILCHVTIAVEGGGKLLKRVGWYRVRLGLPHAIHPDFAAAWIKARRQPGVSKPFPS